MIWLLEYFLQNLFLLFTFKYTSSFINFKFLFLNSAPFNKPVSIRIWKPLQTPSIKHPLSADLITYFKIVDLAAIAPDLK